MSISTGMSVLISESLPIIMSEVREKTSVTVNGMIFIKVYVGEAWVYAHIV